MKKHVIILSSALLLSGALAFQSCSDDDDPITPTEQTPADQETETNTDGNTDEVSDNYTVTLQSSDGTSKDVEYSKGDIIILDGNLVSAPDGEYVESFKVDGFETAYGSYITVNKNITIVAQTAAYTKTSVSDLASVLKNAIATQEFIAVSITDLSEDNFADLTKILSENAININLDISASSSITSIPAEAFKGLNNVVEVTVPSSVQIIDEGAFELCTAIKTVKFKSSNLRKRAISKYYSVSGKTYGGSQVAALIYLDAIKVDGEDTPIYAVVMSGSTTAFCVLGDKDEYSNDDVIRIDFDGLSWTTSGTTTVSYALDAAKVDTINGTKALLIQNANGIGIYWANSNFYTEDGATVTISSDGDFLDANGDAICSINGESYFGNGSDEETSEGGDEPEGDSTKTTGDDTTIVDEGTTTEESGISLEAGKLVIAAQAFNGCKNLQVVTLPSYISYVDANAFTGTTSLKAVVVEGNTQFDTGAFDLAADNNIEVIFVNAPTFSSATLEYLRSVCNNVVVSSDTVMQ